jgi:hypothetical protein
MIMTEEQRRWWFATHPEYSWNRTRARLLGKRPGDANLPGSSNTALANERLRKENFIQKMIDAGWSRTQAEQKWRLSQEHASHAKNVAWAMDMASLIRATGALAAKTASSLAARRGAETGVKLPPKGLTQRDKIQAVKKTGSGVEKQIEAELERGGINPQNYRLAQFKDKHVAQRDSTFDPYQKNLDGRTNIERMEQGNCPLDRDGKYVILHHTKQRNAGPMVEVTTAEHNKIPRRFDPSQINRPEGDRFRENYWTERAKSFSKP